MRYLLLCLALLCGACADTTAPAQCTFVGYWNGFPAYTCPPGAVIPCPQGHYCVDVYPHQ